VCQTIVDRATLRVRTALYPEGVASTIYFARTSLNKLAKTHDVPAAMRYHALLITKRFLFALELAHDVCHGFQNHVMGDRPTDPFFGTATLLAETGYEV